MVFLQYEFSDVYINYIWKKNISYIFYIGKIFLQCEFFDG